MLSPELQQSKERSVGNSWVPTTTLSGGLFEDLYFTDKQTKAQSTLIEEKYAN